MSPFGPPNMINSMPGPGHMMFDDHPMGPGSFNGMRPAFMGQGPMPPFGPPMPGMPGGRVPGMGMGVMGGPPGLSGSGKVYPPNQPLVRNPSNQNAPPIYPCGICHKEVHDNDQAIMCESGCNFWFHRICTGLTEAAFLLLIKDAFAEWVCDSCLHNKKVPLIKLKP